MPIAKPLDGNTTWGPDVRAVIGFANAQNTIYSFEPPPGLNPIAANGTAQAATLQTHLNYVKAQHGGGRVDISRPGSEITLGTTGITIPAGVQLVSDEYTVLSYGGTGAAITVNDSDFTPLVGVRVEGPNWGPTTTAHTSIGISVTGVGLRFYNTRIKHFGRGVDIAHNNTFILTFIGGDIGPCGVCIYADIEAAAVSNSGERIVFDHFTIYNAIRGFTATGNGLNLRFTDCSIDFCQEFGLINNASVFFNGHLETGGAGAGPYLFDLTGNGHLFISDTPIILGGGRTGGLYHVCRFDHGPANYGFGSARTSNVSCYFVDPNGAAQNQFSEHLLSWPSGATTVTFYTPYPLRWSPVTAQFCTTDGYTQPAVDNTVRVTAMDVATGQVTLSATAFAGQRWVRFSVG